MNSGPLIQLPDDLPVPEDDGSAAHLTGRIIPSLKLTSTSGGLIDLSTISGAVVIFAYPMTGEPGQPLPSGWLSIPGAPGCTLESCSFRDLHSEFTHLGATVFGLSTQATAVQSEAKDRLHLPFDLLSDSGLQFQEALNLPAMAPDGKKMIRRITLILYGGKITKVFYPVFPPDTHAEDVVDWLRNNRAEQDAAGQPATSS